MQELLYLTHRIPYPPNKGDKIRAWHMLQFLSRHYRVHLGCFIDDPADLQYRGHLQQICASTCFIEQSPLAGRLRSLGALLGSEAMSLPYYRNPELAAWVGQLLHGGRLHAALAFSGPMAQYLDLKPEQAAAAVPLRRVIDLVDVDSEKWLQYADSKPWPLSALYRREGARLLAFERAVARRFDAVTLVSQAEAALFKRRAPESRHKVSCFNNGVDAEYFSPQSPHPDPYPGAGQRQILVFTGAMDYWPNVAAVEWFALHVMPALRLSFPALQFYIVGTRPAPRVRRLDSLPGMVVTGAVPDVRPYLAHATLAVAPLRIARGIQNKVLEAMAMGKVVLATPQACEGISALAGSELLVATDQTQFIAQISAMLQHGIPSQIGLAARRRVLRDYDWHSNLAQLLPLLGGVIDSAGAARREASR